MIFFLLFFWLFISILYWSFKNGIGPNPTSFKVKRAVLEISPNISSGSIMELGSGFGGISFAMARKYPNCTVIGYETSLIPFYFSKLKLYFFPVKNLEFLRQDFYHIPLNSSKLVFCYLYPKAMERLKSKFLKELSEEAYILTHTFAVPGLTASQTLIVKDLYKTKVYLYQIP